jgi:hypothetical protein
MQMENAFSGLYFDTTISIILFVFQLYNVCQLEYIFVIVFASAVADLDLRYWCG